MEIRNASGRELPQIMRLYEYARRFMLEHGNPNQWGPTRWPPEPLVRADIEAGRCYVCLWEGRIAGVFTFLQGTDIEPTYREIEEGAWLSDSPYGVVHRLAGGAAHGVGSACLTWAFQKCGHLRVDTHPDNDVVQRLLQKNGFSYRGIIHVQQDAYPRLAYEKI